MLGTYTRGVSDPNAPPDVEERYAVASVASDLTLRPTRRGAVDVVLAAGMSGAWLGAKLIHLESEWARTSKPRRPTDDDIKARAKKLPPDKRGQPDLKRARAELIASYARALRDRAMTLGGRNAVVGTLTDWAKERGLDVDLISPTIYHWLDPNCPVCTGRGKLRHESAPVLGVNCWHCRGSGKWPSPHGATPIMDHIRACVSDAKAQMARLLR